MQNTPLLMGVLHLVLSRCHYRNAHGPVLYNQANAKLSIALIYIFLTALSYIDRWQAFYVFIE